MFTDFYFTNASSVRSDNSVGFFQKTTAQKSSATRCFVRIEKCQYGWSYRMRLHWDLSFRFVKRSGNTTPVYHLKTSYTKQKKIFLISKGGIVSMQQSYGNGKQCIDFEKTKGNDFMAVQLYRGAFLIGEQYFKGKYLNVQVDSMIRITQYNDKNKSLLIDTVQNVLNIDFICFKSVYLTRIGDKNTGNTIKMDAIERW
jgi:hypothetical protein